MSKNYCYLFIITAYSFAASSSTLCTLYQKIVHQAFLIEEEVPSDIFPEDHTNDLLSCYLI